MIFLWGGKLKHLWREPQTDTHPHTSPLCLLMMFSHSDTIWTISKIHLTVFHCKNKNKKKEAPKAQRHTSTLIHWFVNDSWSQEARHVCMHRLPPVCLFISGCAINPSNFIGKSAQTEAHQLKPFNLIFPSQIRKLQLTSQIYESWIYKPVFWK